MNSKELTKELGLRISIERFKKGISQNKLAGMIDVSDHKSIWRYENGEQCPSAIKLFQIARALEISADDLNPFF